MTIVVGILCSDGAVIAADKQATHGNVFSGLTVGQRVDKIHLIEDSILFASSGGIGPGQQLRDIVATDGTDVGVRNYHGYVNKVQPKMRAIINEVWRTAEIASKTIGGQALNELPCCLVAAKFKDGLKLAEISPTSNFEYLTEQLPFISVGSGKQNADPFLRYIRHVFFENTMPSVNEGIAFAYWTAQACIDARSTGVGMGVDVCVVNGSNGVARKVEEPELTEAKSFIQALEDSWREVRARMARASGLAIPPLPEFDPITK